MVNKAPTIDSSDVFIFVDIQTALDWLCAWLLEQTARHFDNLKSSGKSSFEARNEMQIFYAKTLSIVFVEVSL